MRQTAIQYPLFAHPDASLGDIIKHGWAEGELSSGIPYRLERYKQGDRMMLAVLLSNTGLIFEPLFRGLNVLRSEKLVTTFTVAQAKSEVLEDGAGKDLLLVQIVLSDKGERLAHCEVSLHDDAGCPVSAGSEDLLARAIAFAAEHHQGQVRKGTNIPYIVHPMEATAIVATMSSCPELAAAAVLHDTLEDCPGVTYELLEKEFGAQVAQWVAAESEEKQADEKGSWKARKQATIDHLYSEHCTPANRMLTLGDKLSNLRAIHRDQLQFGDGMWRKFNQSDKSEQGWYYRGIGQALKALDEYVAWKEFAQLLDKVFGDSSTSTMP